MANIFNLIKRITLTKDKWKDISEEEQQTFNNWMCNKILSMDYDYCEVVNVIQKNTWQMKGEHLYNLYKDLLPKQYKYLKYLKPTNKKEYDLDQIEAIQIYFEVGKKEAKEYIDMLSEDEVKNITTQIKGT